MTGFTDCLRRLFCVPKKPSTWASRSQHSLTVPVPVRIKVHVRNKRQIEYKVEYLVQPHLKEQIYDLRLFLFFPEELDAASTSFFSSLYESIRLHTPTLNPWAFAEPDGAALTGIREALEEQKADLVKGKDARASQKCAVYQLQLLGCRFRRAVRKRGKKIILDLTPTGEGCPAEPDERAASAAICDLLEAADAAICTIEKVCAGCQAGSSPRWQRKAWRLVEEQMLLEARITLLKLASRLDDLYSEAPAAIEAGSSLDRGPLQALREQIADNSSLGSTTNTDHAAQPGYPAAADSSLSATVAGNRGLSGDAASSGREKLAGATGQPQPPQKSSSGAIDVALSEDHVGAAASSRTDMQGADWELSTLSKRLSSRKSKSASLEWIHPLVLLRRMSMSIAKERPQDAHRQSQPDTQISAAPSGNACSPEVPDLEMGLLPRPETDSASALNSNAVKLEKTSPESMGGAVESQERHSGRQLLSAARMLALQQTQRLEALSERGGYFESLLQEDAELQNEHYTDRLKVLKRHARLALTLAPKTTPRSMLADDLVGMTIAGIAMGLALATIYYAQKHSAYGVVYLAVYVAGYILKDRIKEWGKRYLVPMLEWFGIEFPDRVVKFRDYFGRVVGRCREKVRLKDGLDCDARVLRMRYSSQDWVPESKDQVIKPERVLVLSKSMRVRWRDLGARMHRPGVTSLDDIMRIDLHYIMRGMQPSYEKHLNVVRDCGGRLSVQDVDCTRVYHVNSVMEIRTQGVSPEKSLQLQKTRIILDDEGIKRIEPGGDNYLAQQRHSKFPLTADAIRKVVFRSSTVPEAASREVPRKAD